MLETFRRATACPICLKVRRVWIEWLTWLDGQARRNGPLEDRLPTCPEHVCAIIRMSGEQLAVRTAQRALEASASVVSLYGGILRSPPEPSNDRRLGARIAEGLWGPRRRLAHVRGGLTRPILCPVCSGLSSAERRAIELLFALLEDRQHHDSAERAGAAPGHRGRDARPAPVGAGRSTEEHRLGRAGGGRGGMVGVVERIEG
jgi:hypothetical protein